MTAAPVAVEPWTPLATWLSTPEGREDVALYLAAGKTMRFDEQDDHGLDDFVAVILAELAPHLTSEERWAAFEDLVKWTRRRGSAWLPKQTDDACAGVDDAIRRLCGGVA